MKKKQTMMLFLALVVIIVAVPLFATDSVEFGGTDDAGSQLVTEITGEDYEPWFTPVMETWIGGDIPGEVESLIFCLQTGIGVGIIAFFMGRFTERKKWEDKERYHVK